MKSTLIIITSAAVFLSACGSNDTPPAKPPLAKIGPGSGYIEVPRGQEPPSPYWLGPPKQGAYLYAKGPIPGSGALIYVLEDGASEIDAGRLPTNPLRLSISKRSKSQVILDRARYRTGSRRSFNNVKKSPLGGKAYLGTSRRRMEIPINNGYQVIVISAQNEYILNNALALLRPTKN